jgi:acyl-CoA dehydrogenase family protein 9
MDYNNFLTDTYLGTFDQKAFHSFKDVEASGKTNEVINNYLQISKAYTSLELERQKKISSTLLEQLKKIHLFGLNIPSAYGGMELSLTEYLKVVEELSPHNLSLGFTALAHLSIGVKGIVLFGNEEQKRKYLPKAASGEMIFAYALTEPDTGSDARHIKTTAALSEDKNFYVLNGRKAYITNANYAGAMTLFAQMDPEKPGFQGCHNLRRNH